MTRYIKQPKLDSFTILIDDREKRPWKLECPSKMRRLDVGDYTIEGFENKIAIEKKSGLYELLTNLTAMYRPRFLRFLRRLQTRPIRCIVVESELSEMTLDSVLSVIHNKSNGQSRLTKRTVYYWVGDIMMQFGIPILFIDKSARTHMLPEIFRAAYEQARRLK